MATKPLTSEAIALTEKKMDMTLDDIIKMSKNNTDKAKKQRVSNRSKKFLNNAAQDKAAKVQRFMDTRSTIRQGALAQRRTNFQGNQFPLATEAARKAAAVPIRNKHFHGIRAVNVNKTRLLLCVHKLLDSNSFWRLGVEFSMSYGFVGIRRGEAEWVVSSTFLGWCSRGAEEVCKWRWL